MADQKGRDKRPRHQDASGFVTPADNSDDDAGKVDERFLTLVRDALAQDVKQTAMDAIRDVATEAATAAAAKQFAQVDIAMARALTKQDETYQKQFASQAAQVAT
eukprot:7184886-Pyramimonas_sp.AAC.1